RRSDGSDASPRTTVTMLHSRFSAIVTAYTGEDACATRSKTKNQNAGRGRPALRLILEPYCLVSSPVVTFVCAIVQLCSPTLKRAKRRTEMFSPSLPILVAINCDTLMVCSDRKSTRLN